MSKFAINTNEIDNTVSLLQGPLEKITNIGISVGGILNDASYLDNVDAKTNVNSLKKEVDSIEEGTRSTVDYLKKVKTLTTNCETALIKKVGGVGMCDPKRDITGYWDNNKNIKSRKFISSFNKTVIGNGDKVKVNSDPIKENRIKERFNEFSEIEEEITSYQDIKGELDTILAKKDVTELITLANQYGLEVTVPVSIIENGLVNNFELDISTVTIGKDGEILSGKHHISEDNFETIKTELIKEIKKYQEGVINSAINQLKTIRANIPYKNLSFNSDYYDYDKKFDATSMDSKMLKLAELDEGQSMEDYGTVSYGEWLEKNGDISPIEFLQAYYMLYDPDLKYKSEKLSEHNYYLEERGIGNFENISGEEMQTLAYELIYIRDLNPEFERTYNYLYYTKGVEEANKYLKLKSDEISRFAGEKKASEFLNGLENASDVETYLKSLEKGFLDGLDSFSDGLHEWAISSDKKSADEYEKMYIMMALQGNKAKVKQGLINQEGLSSSSLIDYTKDYAKGSEYFYKYSQAIGNMAPSIVVSMMNPIAGSALLGISAGGQNYHQALVEGYDDSKALIYGALTGLTAATLEKLLGTIPGLGKESSGFLLKEMLDEGFQEGLEQLVQSGVWDTMILGKTVDVDELPLEICQSFIDGAIISGILNAPNSAINIVMNGKNYSINLEKAKQIKELMNEDVKFENAVKQVETGGKVITKGAWKSKIGHMRDIVSSLEAFYSSKRFFSNEDIVNEFGTEAERKGLFSNQEWEEMYAYWRVAGPILTAYERGSDVNFVTTDGRSVFYRGSDKAAVDDYFNKLQQEHPNAYYGKDINSAVIDMDAIIEKAPPLRQDTILYRGVNGLFFDGKQLDINSLKPGDLINDSATVSTSLMQETCYTQNDIILQILAPQGTKGVFLGNSANEFLLERGTTFRILSNPEVINGKIVLKVEIVPFKVSDVNLKLGSDTKTELSSNITTKLDNITDKLDDINVTNVVSDVNLKLGSDTKTELSSNITTKLSSDIKTELSDVTMKPDNITDKLDDINVTNVVSDMGLLNDIPSSVSNYSNHFNFLEKGIEIKDFIKTMEEKGLLRKFEDSLYDIDELYSRGSKLAEHDISHVERVMLFSMYMGNYLKLSDTDMGLLIEASKYHDVGVYDGHENHSIKSAEAVVSNLNGKYSKNEINKIAVIVEYHEVEELAKSFESILSSCNFKGFNSQTMGEFWNFIGTKNRQKVQKIISKLPYDISDLYSMSVSDFTSILDFIDNDNFSNIANKYNIPLSEQSDLRNIANILKDADAIDRTRFMNNLDTSYFRNTDIANQLVKTSYQIQEIRGKISLDEIIKDNVDSDLIKTINLYRNSGVPDYVIDFSLKTYEMYGFSDVNGMINYWMGN